MARAQSGDWQEKDQQTLGTIANSLVYEVASTRVNSPLPHGHVLFSLSMCSYSIPNSGFIAGGTFGGLACLGLWEMFGLRMDAERVSLQDHTDLRDEAVGPFATSLASSLPDGSAALSRDPEGRNPWNVVYVFTLQGTVVGFSSPSTLFCPAVHLPQPIQGMAWTGGGASVTPLNSGRPTTTSTCGLV